MITLPKNISEIIADNTGESTLWLEITDINGDFFLITTASSKEEQDYGTFYFDDSEIMNHEEEKTLLKVIESYIKVKGEFIQPELLVVTELLKSKLTKL